jgi:hypothetical protein
MRLDSLPRVALILLSLGTCAVRVHAPSVDTPDAVREVNSCLRMVRAAASRRGRVGRRRVTRGDRSRSTSTMTAS